MVFQESLRKRFKIVGGDVVWLNGKNAGKIAGYLNKDGYREVRFFLDGSKRFLFAHQISFILENGYLADLIDHRDQDTTNNHPDNLREADKRVNAINSGIPRNNTSGVRGVSFAHGKWQAYIKNHQKKRHLGSFLSLEEARIARETAERYLWGDI